MKKILLILLLLLTGCSKQEYSKNLFYMDTVINIKLYNVNEKKANEAFDYLDSLYQKYENLTDFYDSNSELSKLNNDINYEISSELLDLIKIGYEWDIKTNGLLNVNIGNLTKIWHDFRENPVSLPNLDDVKIESLKIENDKILNDKVNIDLGAIVKGYVTEKAGNYLESIGIEYYLINAGGNVKAGKSNKGYYNIGIASPISNETFEIVKDENISVVTSGGYERFYEYNGVMYHHIIDPNTLYPANNMKSVTVIGEDSGLCDILSTTLFLMNIDEGKEFIKDYDVKVIWFTNDNQIIKSDNYE